MERCSPVFLLGMLTRTRGRDGVNVIAMIVGITSVADLVQSRAARVRCRCTFTGRVQARGLEAGCRSWHSPGWFARRSSAFSVATGVRTVCRPAFDGRTRRSDAPGPTTAGTHAKVGRARLHARGSNQTFHPESVRSLTRRRRSILVTEFFHSTLN